MKVDFIDPLHFDPLVHQAFIGTKLTKESTIIIVHANFHWFLLLVLWKRVRVMVFNATFNDISVISWGSVLLVKETGVSRVNHW